MTRCSSATSSAASRWAATTSSQAGSPTTAATWSCRSTAACRHGAWTLSSATSTKPGSYFEVLVWGLDSRFSADYAKGAWYVKTDYKAPNGRISQGRSRDACPTPGQTNRARRDRIPSTTWSIVGGKLYVNRLKDVKTETPVYTLDGKPAGTVEYDGIGSASAVLGRSTDRYGFFCFTSFIQPPTIYRLDTVTGKRDVFFQPKVPFDSSQYELKQVLLQVEGRHPGSHVHRRQERAEAGRDRAPADDRLRRLQPQQPARLESGNAPGGWSRAAGLRCPTCAAAASTARAGTSRPCLRRSRTSSTTGSRRPST